jgi:hypothetical protein
MRAGTRGGDDEERVHVVGPSRSAGQRVPHVALGLDTVTGRDDVEVRVDDLARADLAARIASASAPRPCA